MPEVVQYGAKVGGVSVDEIRPRLVLWRVQSREGDGERGGWKQSAEEFLLGNPEPFACPRWTSASTLKPTAVLQFLN